MGFCRRCGEIVAGDRCKCGGTAVAPVVPWNQSKAADTAQDKWSKIYVQRARSMSPTRPTATVTNQTSQASPTKRFPRPISHTSLSNSNISKQVSAHITSSTLNSNRPPSPLKHSNAVLSSDSDILPSLHDTTLSKVYGSVLQSKETLTTHSCALCSFPFPPDATIYPDPTITGITRFLCRPCYETNGGTKGICPSCSRPVLTLKSEGGFIHAAGQFWHKKCFNCSGCSKNIGDTPVVDLLGRPSCAECFESCFKHDPATPKRYKSNSNNNSPRFDKACNPGGMGSGYKPRQSREGSPAIEELEQRLGITRSREGSPALEDLSQRLTSLARTNSPKHAGDGNTPRRRIDWDRDGARFGRPMEAHNPQTQDIVGSLPNSPTTEPQRFSTRSPRSVLHRSNGNGTSAAVGEVQQRFMKHISSPITSGDLSSTPLIRNIPPLHLSRSSNSVQSSPTFGPPDLDAGPGSPSSPEVPPTPDMLSDFSDTMTQSSLGPDSPPRNDLVDDVFTTTKPYNDLDLRYSRRNLYDGPSDVIVEETSSQLGTPSHTPNSTRAGTNRAKGSVTTESPESPSRFKPSEGFSLSADASSSCTSCGDSLFSIKDGGKYVKVPLDGPNSPPATYHIECFRCRKCGGVFSETASGQAVFVKAEGGACHVECAPPAKIIIHNTPSLANLHINGAPAIPQAAPKQSSPKPGIQTNCVSSRFEQPPFIRHPTSKTSPFPRFGGSLACPGCSKSVSTMEQGVVPGPAGTRWHASCLVCGGKKVAPKGIGAWRGREEKRRTEPGCGKRLDSAAKTTSEGGIWCRECVLLFRGGGSPQASPTRSPLVPSFTGITPQFTGTTTLARQFTGLGGGDPGLLRQLTGGSISPTRSISPTKQLSGGTRPRPKSVVGMRNTRSVDEGRGMFLVRQLTGAG